MLSAIILSIFAFFVILALKDWKKATVLWAAWRFAVGNPAFCVRYNAPAMTLDFAIQLTLLGMFFFKERMKKYSDYPLRRVFWLYIFSYGLSQVFSVLPFFEGIAHFVKFFLQNFGFTYLFFIAVKDLKNLKIFIVNIIIVGAFFSIYGIQEYFTHKNPINSLIISSIPLELLDGKLGYFEDMYDDTSRFGQNRLVSLFKSHIAWSMAAVEVAFLILQLKDYLKLKFFVPLIIILLVGVFISTSKTGMMGAMCLGLLFLTGNNMKNKNMLALFLIGLFVLVPVAANYIVALSSAFSVDASEGTTGSSLAGRMMQFEAGYRLFVQSPIWGYGLNSASELRQIEPLIMGLENSILKISVERGIVGLITYFVLWKDLYNYGCQRAGKWITICFILTMGIMEFSTGNVDYIAVWCIYIAVMRYYEITMQLGVNTLRRV